MKNRFIALLLAASLLAAVFAGCKGRDEVELESNESSSESESSAEESQFQAGPVSSITPDFKEDIEKMLETNEDTVGWLEVPGTDISDVVLQKVDDPANEYYRRRGVNKEDSFNGVYYADFRATFGDGTREQLGVNTCIYGHALTDDKDHANYKIKFGPLHDFRNEEFAKKNPYLYFSTPQENMVFEIVAVFVANCDNPKLPYNANFESGAEYVKMFKDEIVPRSYYHYDTEVNENDKFVTLSTCIYELENGTSTGYPDTWYRYAIVAKLVDPEEELKEEASFTVNEDMLFDEDGRMAV